MSEAQSWRDLARLPHYYDARLNPLNNDSTEEVLAGA
jgi:hypothetical protein